MCLVCREGAVFGALGWLAEAPKSAPWEWWEGAMLNIKSAGRRVSGWRALVNDNCGGFSPQTLPLFGVGPSLFGVPDFYKSL